VAACGDAPLWLRFEVPAAMAPGAADGDAEGADAADPKGSEDSLGFSVVRLSNSSVRPHPIAFELREELCGGETRYSYMPPSGVMAAGDTVDVVIFLDCEKLHKGMLASSEEGADSAASSEAAATGGTVQLLACTDQHELRWWSEGQSQACAADAAGQDDTSELAIDASGSCGAVRLRSQLSVRAAKSARERREELHERAELIALASAPTPCALHGSGLGAHDFEQSVETSHADHSKRMQGYASLLMVDACKGSEDDEHEYAHFGCVLWLMSNGAGLDGIDYQLRTPLMHAAIGAKPLIVELLLRGGARVDLVDTNGATALHLAVSNAAQMCDALELKLTFRSVQLLVSHGASLDAQDHSGCTVLHHAVRVKPETPVGLPLLQLLMDSAAEGATASDRAPFNALIRTRDGQTAEGIARNLGHAQCADLLAQRTQQRDLDLELLLEESPGVRTATGGAAAAEKPKGRKGRKGKG